MPFKKISMAAGFSSSQPQMKEEMLGPGDPLRQRLFHKHHRQHLSYFYSRLNLVI